MRNFEQQQNNFLMHNKLLNCKLLRSPNYWILEILHPKNIILSLWDNGSGSNNYVAIFHVMENLNILK